MYTHYCAINRPHVYLRLLHLLRIQPYIIELKKKPIITGLRAETTYHALPHTTSEFL